MLLLALLLLVPSASFGAVTDFLPRIDYAQGDLEMSMLRQSVENTDGGQGSRSSDLYAVERLKLRLNGFVYHPRLASFFASGASGFSQERYDNAQARSFSDTAVATDYDFRIKFLPEHPYNLELYTLSQTPLQHGQSVQESRSTSVERGAIFDYGYKPIFINIGAIAGESKSRISTADYKSTHTTAAYAGRYVTLNGGHTQTDSSNSAGMRTSNDDSFLGNNIQLGKVTFSGRISETNIVQSSPTSTQSENSSSSWGEQLAVALPWNFSGFASYSFQKNERTLSQATAAADRKDLSETESSGFSLEHRLYDSVRTSYGWTQSKTDSPSGNTKSETHALNGIYTKKLPDGRVTIGGNAMYSLVSQENALLIIDETYNAQMFSTFTLSRENIDATSITIRVPDNTGMYVELTRDTHFIVQQAGSWVNVTIIGLPAQVMMGHPLNYDYTFQATYNLLDRTVELEISTISYNINLMLFNNLVNPYYSHQYSYRTVVTGSLPGGNQETDTLTTGVNIRKEPYMLTTEQRVTDSPVSPSRSLRNAMEYSRRMSDTLSLSARAEVTRTVYGETTLDSTGYTERTSSLNFLIAKNIPTENIIMTASSTYMQRQAIRRTDMYALRGLLTWKHGVFFVNMEASLRRSETTGAGVKQKMLSDLFYLTLNRKLF